MSRMELPNDLYDQEYTIAVADQLIKNPMLDLIAARANAQWIMEHCFIRRSSALQCECEVDYAEYIDDMSLGGETYKKVQP